MKRFIQIIIALQIILVSFESIGASKVSADSNRKPTRTLMTKGVQTKKVSPIINKLRTETKNEVELDIPNSPKHFSLNAITISSYIVVFILGVLTMYWFLKLKIMSILREEKDTYFSELNNYKRYHFLILLAFIKILKIRKDKYKNEFKQQIKDFDDETRKTSKLTDEVQKLKWEKQELARNIQELDKLRNDTSAPMGGLNGDNKISVYSHIGDKSLPNKVLISTYFTIPENDGSFAIEKGEYVLSNKKFYKVESVENNEYGQLFFLSGEFDVKAINNIDYYIIPVCEVENLAISNTATRIEQLKPGTVVKFGNKWVIDKKVKVKLI